MENSSSQQAHSTIHPPRKWRILDQLSLKMDQSMTWPEMSCSLAMTYSSLAYCLSLLEKVIHWSFSNSLIIHHFRGKFKGSYNPDSFWIIIWFEWCPIFVLVISKNAVTRHIFNSLLSVWWCVQTCLVFIFDILNRNLKIYKKSI